MTNMEYGVLIAVVAVAALGAVFMFTTNDASGMATWTEPSTDPYKIATCELGCSQNFQKSVEAGTHPAIQSYYHCITYCHNLPPY